MHWISIIFSTLMPEVIDREQHKCSEVQVFCDKSRSFMHILSLLSGIQSCYEKTKYAENKAKVTV